MTESVASVAYKALNLGDANEQAMQAHEKLCAERYGTINKTLDEIKSIMKWAGGGAFTIIGGLLAFLAAAQFNANQEAQRQSAQKIEMLEQMRHPDPPILLTAPPAASQRR